MAWTCRGKHPVQEALLDPFHPLTVYADVETIPQIGPYLASRIRNALGGPPHRLQDLIQYFQHQPPYTANQLWFRLSSLLRNQRPQQCGTDMYAIDNHTNANKKYHISDTNQCGWNAILLLLRHFQIPNAHNVPLRTRGATEPVRRCGCLHTAARCQHYPGCTWRSAQQIGMTQGRCTPTSQVANGFRGIGAQDRYDQRTARVPNQDQVQVVGGNNTGGPHYYVRRWRIQPGQITQQEQQEQQPIARRTRRQRRQRRLNNAPVASRTRAGRRRRGTVRYHTCGTNIPTRKQLVIAKPDPCWSSHTRKLWEEAVVDRLLTS